MCLSVRLLSQGLSLDNDLPKNVRFVYPELSRYDMHSSCVYATGIGGQVWERVCHIHRVQQRPTRQARPAPGPVPINNGDDSGKGKRVDETWK